MNDSRLCVAFGKNKYTLNSGVSACVCACATSMLKVRW